MTLWLGFQSLNTVFFYKVFDFLLQDFSELILTTVIQNSDSYFTISKNYYLEKLFYRYFILFSKIREFTISISFETVDCMYHYILKRWGEKLKHCLQKLPNLTAEAKAKSHHSVSEDMDSPPYDIVHYSLANFTVWPLFRFLFFDLVAEEQGAEMIVMGARGLGKIKRAILGSVSDYVIRKSKIPVLICKWDK